MNEDGDNTKRLPKDNEEKTEINWELLADLRQHLDRWKKKKDAHGRFTKKENWIK